MIAAVAAIAASALLGVAGAASATELMPRAVRRELNRAESQLRAGLAKLPAGSGIEVVRQSNQVTLRIPAALLFPPDGEVLKQNRAVALALAVPAQLLKSRRRLTAQIEVYTDNIGGVNSNQRLSEQRAQAVLAVLSAGGIPDDRLQAHGEGLAAELASNDTPEGRIENRRVEIVFERAAALSAATNPAPPVRRPLRAAPATESSGA